ncbi:hypothetical protein NPIL_628701 [Nephila pilipes]|uniref:Uncharacterized protein n=1 Tax=Nephila pilipes TaxID=299642 RepID=A0A8X6R383_NEPPI|nr:hypothetical protein NPIL_628701 [Nephila pilipes]
MSVSSYEASIGRVAIIGSTAIAAGFTVDSLCEFPSTAFVVGSGELVGGALKPSIDSLVSIVDTIDHAKRKTKLYGPQHRQVFKGSA